MLPGLEAAPRPAPPRHLPPDAHLPQLREALLAWFAAHQRPLPWRINYTPYEVWISEVMLQQTQMERGVSYFTRWMARFPDVAALAPPTEEEVLRLWEGLGYYSRARHVLAAARLIMEKHKGVFPSGLEDIRALPGVGPYTAGAVASIAFGEKLPCVDANVERVVARVFDLDGPVKQEPAASAVRAWALRLVPEGRAREHNQAMMELGALVCGKKPRCALCPLAAFCVSLHLGIVDQRPVPGKRAAITPIEVVTGVLRHTGRVFVQKRLASGVWGNLWEFPWRPGGAGRKPGTGRCPRVRRGNRLRRGRGPQLRHHPPRLHHLQDHPALLRPQPGGDNGGRNSGGTARPAHPHGGQRLALGHAR